MPNFFDEKFSYEVAYNLRMKRQVLKTIFLPAESMKRFDVTFENSCPHPESQSNDIENCFFFIPNMSILVQ